MPPTPTPLACPKCKKPMELMATTFEAYFVNPAGPPVRMQDLKVFSRIYLCVACKTAASDRKE